MAAGPIGGVLAGIVALFTCMAAAIAYTGAASRVGLALARQGNAPRLFGRMNEKRNTPSGTLLFLLGGFAVVLTLFSTGSISLKMLIQLPNATFICTYLGGCLAGVKLLNGSKWGRSCAWISLVLTVAVYPFLGWMGLYPVLIGVLVLGFYKKKEQVMATL
jgi:amino acid efflux transporter